MSEASFVRWRRYGKDRLYVTATDGTKLGWPDLLTGDNHPESPETVERLAAAVTDWLATHSDAPVPTALARTAAPTAPAATPSVEPAPTRPAATQPPPPPPPPTEPVWEDLAELWSAPATWLREGRPLMLGQSQPAKASVALLER